MYRFYKSLLFKFVLLKLVPVKCISKRNCVFKLFLITGHGWGVWEGTFSSGFNSSEKKKIYQFVVKYKRPLLNHCFPDLSKMDIVEFTPVSNARRSSYVLHSSEDF